jgi:hypothetical protein
VQKVRFELAVPDLPVPVLEAAELLETATYFITFLLSDAEFLD